MWRLIAVGLQSQSQDSVLMIFFLCSLHAFFCPVVSLLLRLDGDSQLDPESSDTSEQLCSEPESEYDVDDKKQDLPPCGQFGMEKWCPGEGCAMCEAALVGSLGDVPLVDIGSVKTRNGPKPGSHQPSSVATLKTPLRKKPGFYGKAEARVCVPEKPFSTIVCCSVQIASDLLQPFSLS